MDREHNQMLAHKYSPSSEIWARLLTPFEGRFPWATAVGLVVGCAKKPTAMISIMAPNKYSNTAPKQLVTIVSYR